MSEPGKSSRVESGGTSAALSRPRTALLFPNQYDEASEVLGRAFVDDPLIRAILPPIADPTERSRRMARLFRVILSDHSRHGQPVWGVLDKGRVVAAAIVEHVSRLTSAPVAIIQGMSGLPALLKATGWSGAFRAVSTLDTLTRNRPAERHLYLNVLGVEPSMQRQHCGIALLDGLRGQASMMTGIAGVYLETALEANVAYYTHAGYEVIGEIYPLGVRMWRMMQRRTS